MLNIRADAKMQEFQIDDCARILYRECLKYDITIAEFSEFITRLKTCHYSECYGYIDVMRVSSDFRSFIRDVIVMRDRCNKIYQDQKRKQINAEAQIAHRKRIADGELYKPSYEDYQDVSPDPKPINNIISSALKRQGVL